MNELQWSFGQLDFLLTDNGLVFLEVLNPNGQWAWLDADQSNGLFAAMKDCIDPDLHCPKEYQVWSADVGLLGKEKLLALLGAVVLTGGACIWFEVVIDRKQLVSDV